MASRMVPEGGWGSRLKPVRTPRAKNRGHLDFIKGLICICCLVHGRSTPADDPMHLRAGSALHGKEPVGGGQTSDDRWVLPGCRSHHDEQHASGDEVGFWRSYGIDPFLLALVLWGLTGDEWAAAQAIREHVRARAGIGP